MTIVNNAVHGSRAKQLNTRRRLVDEIKRTQYVLRELKRQLKLSNPDVVHLNSSCSRFGIFRDLLCVLQANREKVPVVLHCHCNIQDQVKGKAARSAFRMMVNRSADVLTLNRFSQAYVEHLENGKARCVPNFIEADWLQDRAAVRSELRRVIFVGHVQKTKGCHEILKAAKRLPDIEFLLLGPVKDDCRELEIPENVRLPGGQPHEKVVEAMKAADVFLFPSHTEGFAIALTEAMATGLPVVTTDVGANLEMIEDRGGLIVPVGDDEEIVAALKRLFDADVRKDMSRWNVDKVRNCYLMETVMEQFFEIYREVIAGKQ